MTRLFRRAARARRFIAPIVATAILSGASPGMAQKKIVAAVRADAAPFSIISPGLSARDGARYDEQSWSGYTVDICKRAVVIYNSEFGKDAVLEFVNIKASERFPMDNKGDVGSWDGFQLICAAVSITPDRLRARPFSHVIFVDGRAIVTRSPSGLLATPAKDDYKVGYLKGSTGENSANLPDNQRREFETHLDGFRALARREITHYIADRAILHETLSNRDSYIRRQFRRGWPEWLAGTGDKKAADDDGAADRFFSDLTILPSTLANERYAIPVTPENPKLLWAVNLAVMEMFQNHFRARFAQYFPETRASPLLRALVIIRGGDPGSL